MQNKKTELYTEILQSDLYCILVRPSDQNQIKS